MTVEMDEAAQVAAAVDVQRQSDDKFVRIDPVAAHLPGLLPALVELAAETGRPLASPVYESAYSRCLREHVTRLAEAPAIDRTNHRAVLENLDGIRAGKVRIK